MVAGLRFAVSPSEHAFGLLHRIDHQRHLAGIREEVVVDENVPLGKKNAESGMGMIPADDLQIDEAGVHLVVDLVPGFVGEGDFARLLGGLVAADALGDYDERSVIVLLPPAHQHAADLDGRIFAGMLDDPLVGFGVEIDAEVRVRGGKRRARQLLAGELSHVG